MPTANISKLVVNAKFKRSMKNIKQILIIIIFLYSADSLITFAQDPGDYFIIHVIDKDTRRGVPLVELKTINSILYYTDNNGIIAFYEPGLMDQEVYFYIKSHGYDFPKDGFGNRGKALKVTKGGDATIEIRRTNIAERLYRITGQGLYHHSLLVSHPVLQNSRLLNGKVMGQDGGLAIPYNNKLYWFWGDTDQPSYPLGNFACCGAVSKLPGNGGLDPATGIELSYFINDSSGFCKEMFPSNEFPGPGVIWPSCLMTLENEEGREILVAKYSRMKNLGEPYEMGLATYDDEIESFKKLVQFDLDATFIPDGHTFPVTIRGEKYYYFASLYPNSTFFRVKANLTEIKDLKKYESFTCLSPGKKYEISSPRVERNKDGVLVYDWKANTSPVGPDREHDLISAGLIKRNEAWFILQDINTGKYIKPFSGSVQWNNFLRRWVMIVQQNVGEVWFAEGDTPVGPWIYAQKVVEHQNYTFYLPAQHPYFNHDGGRYIYFEGTYTNSFSGNRDKTPRYNYNQIMYRLDLEDPRIYLPEPVYSFLVSNGNRTYMMRDEIDSLNLWKNIYEIPFFAFPKSRKLDKLIPVYLYMTSKNIRLQTELKETERKPLKILFYALPSTLNKTEQITGIWECDVDGYPVNIEITTTGNDIAISFEDESLTATKVNFYNDTIQIQAKDSFDGSDYVITASISEGKMNGNIEKIGVEEISTIKGECVNLDKKFSVSPVVVPLYEYKDETGKYYYSTSSELPKMKRSENPICYVWENPSSTVALDFEAKPVPIVK